MPMRTANPTHPDPLHRGRPNRPVVGHQQSRHQLTPDKAAVYKDIFRILRPGGRLSVADIVLRGSPEALQGFPKSIALRSWCACVSGALVEEEYLATIRDAGFADVRLVGEHAAGVTAVAVTITARKPPEQPLLASDPYEWALVVESERTPFR